MQSATNSKAVCITQPRLITINCLSTIHFSHISLHLVRLYYRRTELRYYSQHNAYISMLLAIRAKIVSFFTIVATPLPFPSGIICHYNLRSGSTQSTPRMTAMLLYGKDFFPKEGKSYSLWQLSSCKDLQIVSKYSTNVGHSELTRIECHLNVGNFMRTVCRLI